MFEPSWIKHNENDVVRLYLLRIVFDTLKVKSRHERMIVSTLYNLHACALEFMTYRYTVCWSTKNYNVLETQKPTYICSFFFVCNLSVVYSLNDHF